MSMEISRHGIQMKLVDAIPKWRDLEMLTTDLFDFAYVPDWYGQLDELSG